MHAFLIIGKYATVHPAGAPAGCTRISFPIKKIEDVRSLNGLIRLSFNQPTLIICENIHEATEEALNAFLKNLEEPQENIYFALTSSSIRSVLPTVVSRCQVIKIRSTKYDIVDGYSAQNNEEIIKFLNLKVDERLNYIDTIKDRKKAIELTESLVYFLHSKLHEKEVKYDLTARKIEVVQETLTCLKLNGNVNLHLSKIALNL